MIALLLCAGCGTAPSGVGVSGTAPGPPPGVEGCAPGQRAVADVCVEAGVRDDGCAAGEHMDRGACRAAGVPEDGCGAGFETDGEGGCEPTLPAEACEQGSLAVVGESECHEVAPCGDDPWPSMPDGAEIQFVDAAYAGSDSDGSAARPWTRLQDGVDAASAAAMVAVAAGSYLEDVVIEKPVRVFGRCPALVEVVGSATAPAAVQIRSGADGAELRALSITGAAQGLEISGAEDVTVAAVHIHDTAWRGAHVHEGLGHAAAAFDGVLIERAHRLGVWVEGSDVSLVASAVRDTVPGDDGLFGEGLFVEAHSGTGRRATLTLVGSILEHNTKIGVVVAGADATIDETVVRATAPTAEQSGRGIQVQDKPTLAERGRATIRTSVFERSVEVGIYVVASDVSVERTVVRDTDGSGIAGGIVAVPSPEGEPSVLQVDRSLVDGSGMSGIHVEGSDADVDATIVRRTKTPKLEELGQASAIAAQNWVGTTQRARIAVRGCVIEDNDDVGIYVHSSDAHIEGTRISRTSAATLRGAGLAAAIDPATADPPLVMLHSSVIEGATVCGVFAQGSDITLLGAVVGATQPVSDGSLGRGLCVQNNEAAAVRSHATIASSRIEDNREVGVFVAGSDLVLEDSTVRRVDVNGSGQTGSGVVIQEGSSPSEQGSSAELRRCVVEDVHEFGVLVFGSQVHIESTAVLDVQPAADGLFGDGLAAAMTPHRSAEVEAVGLHIAAATRAAVTSFGATVRLSESTLDCNPIDLDGEVVIDTAYVFEDGGGNRCGCGQIETECIAISSSLQAPEAVTTTAADLF